jgi:hypothetical protein
MIEEFCREAKDKWVTCIGALATLIDICEEHALREKNKTKIEEAVEVSSSFFIHWFSINKYNGF